MGHKAWRIGLTCLSILSLATGMFAGVLGMAALLLGPELAGPSKTASIFIALIPMASVGLGLWSWRTNRVWRMVSAYTIGAGVLGILFVVIPAALVLVSEHRR